jgi:alpha-N-arabinofuranosidase
VPPVAIALCVVLAIVQPSQAAAPPETPLRAEVAVLGPTPGAAAIPREITGKFCEHLGTNIYNGMDSQILRNPTLADWPFASGQTTPDGIVTFLHDPTRIAAEIRQQSRRWGWPDATRDQLVHDRADSLACWWVREGTAGEVEPSPDTGPHGRRAQRIEVRAAPREGHFGIGIAQWTYLPLHRARKYQFEIVARSPDLKQLAVSLWGESSDKPLAQAAAAGLSGEWSTLRGTLEVDTKAPADPAYRFALTTDKPGQFVVARVWLRPADHVGGADPDVVRLLKASHLPLLRWPGGNFVSGYHWEDGIGPLERRAAVPNYAWGGVETHHFGTDEFIAFCRAVGCEPMICVNAGNAPPEEAARWIEYCNGPADSPMGRLRAANGHPEPYRVRHWEVGNELWGKWQVHWTTAAGYADRYRQFVQAMRAADPSIELYACGAPVFWGKNWNTTLLRAAGPLVTTITDHPLIGGQVASSADPMDLYRDFMAVPDVLASKWSELAGDMKASGVNNPKIAVTELQMFANIGGGDKSSRPRLTRETLVAPPTMGEALYDVLIYHRAIRLGTVSMVTHSATVNHGGGLRKERERVYANPCHEAQGMFAAMAGATPLDAEVACARETAPRVMPALRDVTPRHEFAAIDVLPALAPDGSLLISLVHRGTQGPLQTTIALGKHAVGPKAEIVALSAEVPWAVNTLRSPQAIRPVDSTAEVRDGKLTIDVKPFTVMRIRIPKGKP